MCAAAAVGALLFSVRMAVTAFQDLPADRALAGRIAGRAFTGAYAIAAVAGAIVIAVLMVARVRRMRTDASLAVVLLASALLELFWIAPAILRRGSGWPGSFASLHATGGALHVLLSMVALVLAWRLLDDSDAAIAQRF